MRSELFLTACRSFSAKNLLSQIFNGKQMSNKSVNFLKKTLKNIFHGSAVTLATVCVGCTIFTEVGYPACVSGTSMKPVLNDNSYFPSLSWLRLNVDWVFVNCWAAKHEKLVRGEVVVMISPKDPYDYIIKRLIGLEGDVIVHEKYANEPLTLDHGSCWVEGDNGRNSVDSNSSYGPVCRGLIFGKATHIIWPPEKLGRITTEIPETYGRKIEYIKDGQNVKIVHLATSFDA